VIISCNNSWDKTHHHAFLRENDYAHLPRIVVWFLMVNGMMLNAQTEIHDSLPNLSVKSPWENVIHFHGYLQKRPNELVVHDSLTFNGFKTVKKLTIQEFMRLTQGASDKYRLEMEAIYKPLLEEQEKINKSGVGKGFIRYNANIGFFDPMKAPIVLMNPNNEKDRKPDWDGR
jgi:hypothetical protein